MKIHENVVAPSHSFSGLVFNIELLSCNKISLEILNFFFLG